MRNENERVRPENVNIEHGNMSTSEIVRYIALGYYYTVSNGNVTRDAMSAFSNGALFGVSLMRQIGGTDEQS